jgi:outer membrane lipoprotein carrier protein
MTLRPRARQVTESMKRFIFCINVCAACAAGVPAAANAAAIDELHRFISGTRSAECTFTQTVIGKSGRKPQRSSGTMAFSRPGKFRWTYVKPYQQLIVGDGDKLWVYDQDLNQVTVKKLGKALGSSPAALLAGDDAIEKNFKLSEGGSAEGTDWVDAKPLSEDSTFVRLRIGFAGGMLKAMEIEDNFGQMTTLQFGTVQRNPALPASLFHFVPPKGADVVGE